MSERDEHDKPSEARSYEVGYGRPPKGSQFKPGQSGNPKGRKRKPKSVQAQMQDVLAKKIPITEGGKTKKLSVQEVILRNIANQAAKGDLKAATFIFNLLNSPDLADTDTIDQSTLSAEDQALFDQMISQFLGSSSPPDLSAPSGCSDPEDPSSAALAEHQTGMLQEQTSDGEENDHDDQSRV